jgi:hypothetical protein
MDEYKKVKNARFSKKSGKCESRLRRAFKISKTSRLTIAY